MATKKTVAERLIANSMIDPTSGCWVWMRSRFRGGYGQMGVAGKNRSAHRVSYEHFVEKIPEGLVLDHICRNRGCINPAHLRVVTHKVNSTENVVGIAWQLNLAKTSCPLGHEYSEENTYVSSRGYRKCRTCDRLKYHERVAAKREP